MNKNTKGNTMFKTGKICGHMLIMIFCFFSAHEILKGLLGERDYIITWIYVLSLEGAWILLEAGDVEKRRFLDLMYSQFFGALAANFFFGIQMCFLSTESILRILKKFLILMLLEAGLGMVWAGLSFHFYLKSQSFRKALMVYGEKDNLSEIIEKNNRSNSYFKIIASIHFAKGIDEILRTAEKFDAIYLGEFHIEERDKIIKYCISLGKECYCIPQISDIYMHSARVLQLQDKVLFQKCAEGLTKEQTIVKRIADIFIASILLLLFSPIMILISFLIYIDDGSPVFYRQKRYTKDCRPFTMLKFRSMHLDAERYGARLATRNDRRVTSVGKLLRNLHFDELPQLINVIKGDMSMVGPRPERWEFIEEYSCLIPEFPERMKVKGGLTGYAQIYGKYNTGPEDKIKYDLIYIHHYSLKLDLRLLLLTVRILFQKENSEGVEEGQISAVKARKEKENAENKTS